VISEPTKKMYGSFEDGFPCDSGIVDEETAK